MFLEASVGYPVLVLAPMTVATGTTGIEDGAEGAVDAGTAAGSISCGLESIFFSFVDPMSKGEM